MDRESNLPGPKFDGLLLVFHVNGGGCDLSDQLHSPLYGFDQLTSLS